MKIVITEKEHTRKRCGDYSNELTIKENLRLRKKKNTSKKKMNGKERTYKFMGSIPINCADNVVKATLNKY